MTATWTASEREVPCIARSGEVVAVAAGWDADQAFVDLWDVHPLVDAGRTPSRGPFARRFHAEEVVLDAGRGPFGRVRAFVESGTPIAVVLATISRASGIAPPGVTRIV